MSAAVFRGLYEALIFAGALGVLVTGCMLIREEKERRERLRRRKGR